MRLWRYSEGLPLIGMPMVGQTVSHYRIIEKIGGGWMGVVYKAEETNLRRQFVLEALPDQFATDRQLLARLERRDELSTVSPWK